MFRMMTLLTLLLLIEATAQFKVTLPPNPYPLPDTSELWHVWEKNFLENIQDTTITLRLGQYFEFSADSNICRTWFDSVDYRGGGNNRRAVVRLELQSFWRDSLMKDTMRVFTLPYPTVDSTFGVNTLYMANDTIPLFQVQTGLEKIIGTGPLSIAKLRILKYGVMAERFKPLPAAMMKNLMKQHIQQQPTSLEVK